MLRVGVIYDRIVDMADDMYLPEKYHVGAKKVADSCVKAQNEGNHEVAKFFYDFIEEARLYIKMLVKEFEEPGGERSAQMEAGSYIWDLFEIACEKAVQDRRYDVLCWVREHNMEIGNDVLLSALVVNDLDMVRFLVEDCGVKVYREAISFAVANGNNEFVEMVQQRDWYIQDVSIGGWEA